MKKTNHSAQPVHMYSDKKLEAPVRLKLSYQGLLSSNWISSRAQVQAHSKNHAVLWISQPLTVAEVA